MYESSDPNGYFETGDLNQAGGKVTKQEIKDGKIITSFEEYFYDLAGEGQFCIELASLAFLLLQGFYQSFKA